MSTMFDDSATPPDVEDSMPDNQEPSDDSDGSVSESDCPPKPPPPSDPRTSSRKKVNPFSSKTIPTRNGNKNVASSSGRPVASKKTVRRGKIVPVKKPSHSSQDGKLKQRSGGIIRPRRWKPGTAALREIRREQKIAHQKPATRRRPFERVVREIMQDYKEDLRITKRAMDAFQLAFEEYAIKLFSGSSNFAYCSGLVTIFPKHLHTFLLTDKESYERVGYLIPWEYQNSIGDKNEGGISSSKFHRGFSNNFGRKV